MSKLISTVNYPITVKYDGQAVVVSPHESINIKRPELLPADLPAGIVLIKQ
jgi:hypothetical protein